MPENADTTGATGATALPEAGLELLGYSRSKPNGSLAMQACLTPFQAGSPARSLSPKP